MSKMSIMLSVRPVILGIALLGASACNRRPQAYLERGNTFAAEHKYQEASIQYKKALQKNPQFGEAVYRLALSELGLHNLPESYRLLVRAVGVMPDNDEAKVKLADLALAIY